MSKEEFKSKIKCFAIMEPNHLAWACGCCIRDECRDWLRLEYDTTDAEYANIIHGFIHKDGYAVICKGFNRDKVDINKIPESFLKQIVDFAIGFTEPKKDCIEVYNGQHIGEPGVLWEPIENLGCFGLKY